MVAKMDPRLPPAKEDADVWGIDALNQALSERLLEHPESLETISFAIKVELSWLKRLSGGGEGCILMLNRLANYFAIRYIISNTSTGGHVDAANIDGFCQILHSKLLNFGDYSIQLVANEIDIETEWLTQFKAEQAICLRRMMRLAEYFGVRFVISNFLDEHLEPVVWFNQ